MSFQKIKNIYTFFNCRSAEKRLSMYQLFIFYDSIVNITYLNASEMECAKEYSSFFSWH